MEAEGLLDGTSRSPWGLRPGGAAAVTPAGTLCEWAPGGGGVEPTKQLSRGPLPTCVAWTVRGCVPGGAYLAEADGIVEGLRPRVEVHRLPHLLLALVLAGQVVGRCPVAALVGDLSSLEREQGAVGLCLRLPMPRRLRDAPTF